MSSHPDQVGSSCKLSQSQYIYICIIEPNLTEVDVSQVQHVGRPQLYTVGPNFWETACTYIYI